MTQSQDLRADRLNGRKIKVGAHSVTALKKIGEGGFAFVYLARPLSPSSSPKSSPTSPSNDTTSIKTKDKRKTDTDAIPTPTTVKYRLQRRYSERSSFTSSTAKQPLVVLKTTVAESDALFAQAKNEADMLRTLSSHPNILKIIDHGFSSAESSSSSPSSPHSLSSFDDDSLTISLHFLLVEYCAGGSLMDLIAKRRRIRSKQLHQQNKRIPGPHPGGVPGVIFPSVSSAAGLCSSSPSSPSSTSKRMSKWGRSVSPSRKWMTKKRQEERTLERVSGGFLSLNDILDIFRQLASAVSFMHNRFSDGVIDDDHTTDKNSQQRRIRRRYPIIHRDLKPENVLFVSSPNKNRRMSNPADGQDERDHFRWSCKICDFGSAITGRVPLGSAEEREDALEVILTSTTQMYRAPEMINLHMVDELTERTDIWALGCCLYAVTFLQNCFDENANLAIISGKYDIPREHSYSHKPLIELIRRMLVVDPQKRADIDEVVDFLERLEKGEPLPEWGEVEEPVGNEENEPFGQFCTNGQGAYDLMVERSLEAKKLKPNSVAARRKTRRQLIEINDTDTDTIDRGSSIASSPSRASESIITPRPNNDTTTTICSTTTPGEGTSSFFDFGDSSDVCSSIRTEEEDETVDGDDDSGLLTPRFRGEAILDEHTAGLYLPPLPMPKRMETVNFNLLPPTNSSEIDNSFSIEDQLFRSASMEDEEQPVASPTKGIPPSLDLPQSQPSSVSSPDQMGQEVQLQTSSLSAKSSLSSRMSNILSFKTLSPENKLKPPTIPKKISPKNAIKVIKAHSPINVKRARSEPRFQKLGSTTNYSHPHNDTNNKADSSLIRMTVCSLTDIQDRICHNLLETHCGELESAVSSQQVVAETYSTSTTTKSSDMIPPKPKKEHQWKDRFAGGRRYYQKLKSNRSFTATASTNNFENNCDNNNNNNTNPNPNHENEHNDNHINAEHDNSSPCPLTTIHDPPPTTIPFPTSFDDDSPTNALSGYSIEVELSDTRPQTTCVDTPDNDTDDHDCSSTASEHVSMTTTNNVDDTPSSPLSRTDDPPVVKSPPPSIITDRDSSMSSSRCRPPPPLPPQQQPPSKPRPRINVSLSWDTYQTNTQSNKKREGSASTTTTTSGPRSATAAAMMMRSNRRESGGGGKQQKLRTPRMVKSVSNIFRFRN